MTDRVTTRSPQRSPREKCTVEAQRRSSKENPKRERRSSKCSITKFEFAFCRLLSSHANDDKLSLDRALACEMGERQRSLLLMEILAEIRDSSG